jgi:hypothetical protein
LGAFAVLRPRGRVARRRERQRNPGQPLNGTVVQVGSEAASLEI